MTQMGPVSILLLGMIGAAAPEILRLYSLRTKPKEVKWSGAYVALSLPFLLLGGVLALVLPATTPWGAFYTGLSTPVVITVAIRRLTETKARQTVAPPSDPSVLSTRPSALVRVFLQAL